jgi:hypothetical protein
MPCLSLSSAEAKPKPRDSPLQDWFLPSTVGVGGRSDRFSSIEKRFRWCESVGERWCDGAGCLLTLGFRSHRCLHACWQGKLMGPIFDCRETVMGPSPWRHTACESVGERWCDGAGCLLPLISGRTGRCTLAWGGCDPIFDCRVLNGDGAQQRGERRLLGIVLKGPSRRLTRE